VCCGTALPFINLEPRSEKTVDSRLDTRVPRRIFGRKGDSVTQDWTKLHSEEPRDLNVSHNIDRVMV
jgi:hypothetical protein